MRTLVLATALAVLQLCAQPGLEPVDEASYQKLLAASKGRVLLVDFWATWCEPCRAEMPGLVKLEARLRAKGLRLVTVSADEPDEETGARKFVEKTGVPAPWYVKRPNNDDRFINSVDPNWSGALPALFLYDKAGRKAASFIGETPISRIEAAIQKIL